MDLAVMVPAKVMALVKVMLPVKVRVKKVRDMVLDTVPAKAMVPATVSALDSLGFFRGLDPTKRRKSRRLTFFAVKLLYTSPHPNNHLSPWIQKSSRHKNVATILFDLKYRKRLWILNPLG